MLPISTVFAIAAAFTSTATALQPQLATCDSQTAPKNWDDCEFIIRSLGWRTAGSAAYNATDQKDWCSTWTSASCTVALCWLSNDFATLTHQELAGDYRILETQCKPDQLGGWRDTRGVARLEVRKSR